MAQCNCPYSLGRMQRLCNTVGVMSCYLNSLFMWAAATVLSGAVAGAAYAGESRVDNTHQPQRIISLNLCTDQIVMMLVPRRRIMAVTRLSQQSGMSVMARVAQTLPTTNGQAEQVFMLKPDLVLAGTYSTHATTALLRKLKRHVVVVPPATSFQDIFRNVEIIGRAVGEKRRAAKLIAGLQHGLRKLTLDQNARLPLAALYFARGYSAGQNTLANAVVRKGGMQTLGDKLKFRGTGKLSLERLILSRPAALIFGHRKFRGEAMAYDVFRHPAMRHLKANTRYISLADALTICGTPETLKAVYQVRQFARSFESGNLGTEETGKMTSGEKDISGK